MRLTKNGWRKREKEQEKKEREKRGVIKLLSVETCLDHICVITVILQMYCQHNFAKRFNLHIGGKSLLQNQM